MRVAVIGASGGMGSFFVRYFLARGESVSGSDKRPMKDVPPGMRFFSSNSDAVKGSDVTILATPMDETVAALRGVAKSLKRGSLVVEIGSIKGDTLPSLRRALGGRGRLVSIHPLFGPALVSTKGMKVAVISGREEAARLFPEARIIPMGSKEHDRAMAVVLGLTHIMNLAYAGTAARFLTPDEFTKVSTPNSSMQLTLAEAVLAQDPRLTSAIQARNPYSKAVARAALKELERISRMVEASDARSLEGQFRRLSKRYKADRRAAAVIGEVYSAAEKQP